MPGPQLLFAHEDFAGISETEDTAQLSKVRAEVVKQFLKDCGDGVVSFGKSFASFPLAVPHGTNGRERIGVINLYSNRRKIMGGREERWQIYSMVMRPYIDGVATLLKSLL